MEAADNRDEPGRAAVDAQANTSASRPRAWADPSGPHTSSPAIGIRAVLGGVFVNGILAIAKLIAGLLGHSQALIADAVESLADMAGSTIVWGGLAVAARPPDDDHPYGHGKAESLATLVVAFMLLGAAIGIAIQSVRELLTPQQGPAAFTLPVLIGVVIIKELLYRRLARAGTLIGSTAVQSDAWHHRADALTSLAAAVGITIALVGGEAYAAADDWAALAACVVIGVNGARFLKTAVGELMDARPDEVFLSAIRRTALNVDDVLGVEKLFARRAGSRFLVDLHLEVDPQLTVEQGHHVGHQVKKALLEEHPRIGDVLVHLEPHGIPRSCASAGYQPRPPEGKDAG